MLRTRAQLMGFILLGVGMWILTIPADKSAEHLVEQNWDRMTTAKHDNPQNILAGSLAELGEENFHTTFQPQGLQGCVTPQPCRAGLEIARKSGTSNESQLIIQKNGLEANVSLPQSDLTKTGKPVFAENLMRVRGNSLFARLNPFHVESAMAQTPFSLSLSKPTYWSTNPLAWATLASGQMFNGTYILQYSMRSNFAGTEEKPYIVVTFTASASGWYLIDFYGQKAKAKLRHLENGPIVANWDMSFAPGGPNVHYITSQYLEAGLHRFYFWVVKHNGAPTYSPGTAIYGITVDSI